MRPAKIVRRSILAVVLFGFVALPTAQTSRGPAGLVEDLRFRAIGPAIFGGRIDDVAVYEANPAFFYAGATTGGLWKT